MAPPMVLGLQMSVCNLEFSVYYGHQLCCTPTCPTIPDLIESPTCWLVHASPVVVPSNLCGHGSDVIGLGNNFSLVKSLSNWPDLVWTGQESFILEKVRATSFILLLGVGSFVCYRIFHTIKCRIANKRKHSTTCKKLHRKRTFGNKCGHEEQVCQDDISSDISSCSDISTDSSFSIDDQLTSCESSKSENVLVMGVSSSQPTRRSFDFEPVRYNKVSGIVFKRSDREASSPLNHVVQNTNNSARRVASQPGNTFKEHIEWTLGGDQAEDKENGFDISGSFGGPDGLADPFIFDEATYIPNDATSLKGNFSPGSLRERVMKAGEPWSSTEEQPEWSNQQRPNSLVLMPKVPLKRQFSTESFSLRSDSRGCDWSISRTFSIDSQISELAPDLQQEAEEIGCVAVEKIETLETELIDLKKTVLDLDAQFVQLQFYKKPPEKCWELTNISFSDGSNNEVSFKESDSSILKVVQHHKAKMWYKGLLDCTEEEPSYIEGTNEHASILDKEDHEVRWDLVSKRLLDWDLEGENTFDSGSDFGNSLETDSVEFDVNSTAPNSLEWDSDGLTDGIDGKAPDEPDGRPRSKTVKNNSSSENSHSSGVRVRSQKRKRFMQRRNSSLESPAHKINRTKSNNASSSSVLLNQIQKAIAGKTEAMSPSTVDFSPVSQSSEMTCSMMTPSSSNGILMEGDKRKYKDSMQEDKIDEGLDGNGNVHDVLRQKQNTWDSAYCEDSDFPETSETCIGETISVAAYIGSLSQNNIVKGYEAMSETLDLKHMRKMRGDKSCILRSTLFGLLTHGHSVLQGYGGAASVYQALTSWSQTSYPWLLEWAFANRLPYKGGNCLKGFWDCLQSLQEMEENLKLAQDPECFLAEAVNQDSELDTKLIEAAKLLMTSTGLKLHRDLEEGKGDGGVLNMFAMLLFNRSNCTSPRDLVMEQINHLGLDAVLDQVGLYLLGQSLCASLKIVRPHLVNSASFLTLCPDWNRNVCPEVVLATEDEQNYWLVS